MTGWNLNGADCEFESNRGERRIASYDLAVVGLGYVGLPLALGAACGGLRILGYDVDAERIDLLQRGESYLEVVSSERLEEALREGLEVTSQPGLLEGAEAVAVCVPTPLTGHLPDLSAVEEAARTIGNYLRPGRLVILESTTYPGTTEDVFGPLLEETSGLRAGQDFDLAYSPERIDPGNRQWGLRNTPKLVAGTTPEAASRATSLYRKFCDEVVVVSGVREAEMAKLLENTYRHVNIALVNEMAIFCRELGVDIWEVIRAAATKPFGFQAFYPGPGVGGHCIPIDPSYLSHRVRQLGYPFRFVELAQEINAQMPAFVVRRVAELLNRKRKAVNGSRILVLGVAYKPDVADTRETPAEEVIRRLRSSGAEVWFSDPYVEQFTVEGKVVERCPDPVDAADDVDLVLLLTAHRTFDLDTISRAASCMLDTRGVTKGSLAERL